MELHELIEAVKAVTDKNALEALVKAELSIDLDKRKSLESLRAEILTGLGVDPATADPITLSAEPVVEQPPAPAPELVPAQDSIVESVLSQPIESTPAPIEHPAAPAIASDLLPPEAETDAEQPVAEVKRNRLLRNKDSGRTVIWTHELAKLPSMEEV